jgi:hypothetical protein
LRGDFLRRACRRGGRKFFALQDALIGNEEVQLGQVAGSGGEALEGPVDFAGVASGGERLESALAVLAAHQDGVTHGAKDCRLRR